MLGELNSLLRNRFADDLKDVILFGSSVSGGTRSDSDYDVLVVLRNKATWEIERAVSDLCYDLELKYGIMIDTHVIGVEELSTLRGKQPVFVNALSDGLHA